MPRGDQKRPSSCEGQHDGMSTLAGIDVQQQLETLIQSFQTGDPPMPVVVLHAEDTDADVRVTALVDELREGQRHHGTRHAVALDASAVGGGPARPDGVGSPTERAVHLVRHLGDPRGWGERSASYRRYSFPRLNLVRAIHDAVEAPEMRTHWSPEPADDPSDTLDRRPGPVARAGAQQQLLRLLAKQHWRPRRPSGGRYQLLPPAMQQIVLTSMLGGLTALLTRAEWFVFVPASLALVVVLLAMLNQVPGRAPLLLWLRRESRWFLTTTFLRAGMRQQPTDVRLLHPVRSWRTIAARAFDVAEELRGSGEFPLRLYVLALLEDLRDNHRRWSWDLRGFKRNRPPMLFLRGIGNENGGIELIKAVSDVRSRRSEIDPLLIVAGVAAADVPRLERSIVRHTGSDREDSERLRRRLSRWYVEWAGNLRSGQSPSQEQTLPWVLKIPLPARDLSELREHEWRCMKARPRLPVARALWSVYSLTASMALLGATGTTWYDDRYGDHCSNGLLSVNQYTARKEKAAGEIECIGIATDGFRFSGQGPKSKDTPGLKQLEKDIGAANAEVLKNHRGHYVTIVYAGPLSPDDEGTSPVKGVEELKGVYLAQRVINSVGTPVKLRVLAANGGVDLQDQMDMAGHIADYAATDPTVVGVVGLGRDLESSDTVVAKLRDAGLPVVSGTNSATYLPERYMNWFSLAATDEWQAEQLGRIADQLDGTGKKAVVLVRNTDDTDDKYTREQAKYGLAMLKKKDFQLAGQGGLLKYDLPERDDLRMRDSVDEICVKDGPSVIYFAGRVEDLQRLAELLNTTHNCSERAMAILTGDDLSKGGNMDHGHGLASKVTLYTVGLTALDESKDSTRFYAAAKKYLKIDATPDSFASGQTPLSHDATRALFEAASNGTGSDASGEKPQTRAATAANLWQLRIANQATGDIDFTTAEPFGGRTGHSIRLTEIPDSGKARRLCQRPAGVTDDLHCKKVDLSPGK
ncbi:ABC transporter substrate-binding protein [Streptomyces sp. NPDC047070]|uniref:ABC transporter substrate-binding protein n=1 Tax=Streptomyces sp. NPDC047070 TaxID=3154923 RepID=UPI00345470DF